VAQAWEQGRAKRFFAPAMHLGMGFDMKSPYRRHL